MLTKNSESYSASSNKNNLYYLNKNYYICFGFLFFLLWSVNYFIKILPLEYSGYLLLLGVVCLTVKSDLNQETDVKPFLKIAIPFLILIIFVLASGNDIWHRVLSLELKIGSIIELNGIFKAIPFNDAALFRIYQPALLTEYMKLVYNTGFVLAVLIPLFRSALCLDFKKMLKYTLSAHIFQVIIITPFYFIFHLQEVWYVYNVPDMLVRNLGPSEIIETTLNCLPSMHTSIAFAMFLLVLREKDKFFKFFWGFYCISVIFSTMYLEIHWVIDVFGGLLLGYLTVKLVDYVIIKITPKISKKFKIFIEKQPQ